MSFIIINLSIVLLCILLQSFFSCSEMSIVSANKLKIHYLAKQGNKNAILLDYFYANPHKFLGTTLVGVNLFVVIGSTITAHTVSKIITLYFKDLCGWESIISTALLWPFVLIMGEIVPLNLGQRFNNTIALKVVKFIRLFYFLLFPIIFIATTISKILNYIFKGKSEKFLSFTSKKEIDMIFKEVSDQGNIKKDNFYMLSHILKFKNATAEDIMVPLINVKMLSYESEIEELFSLLKNTGFSKFPVYKERVDNVVGIVNIRDIDLNKLNNKTKVSDLISSPYFIPETKPVNQILQEMKINLNHFAVVVDEYGGVTGVVSLEDILEEIIGEINDEFDKPVLSSNINIYNLEFPANIQLNILYEKYKINFKEKKNVETLAGLILLKTSSIPQTNKIINIEDYKIKIIKANDRKIIKVKFIK